MIRTKREYINDQCQQRKRAHYFRTEGLGKNRKGVL